jgi:hypothetical protein
MNDDRICRTRGCGRSLAGLPLGRVHCDEHRTTIRRERQCRECDGSLDGLPSAQQTCNDCKYRQAASRKRRPRGRPPTKRAAAACEAREPRPPAQPIPAHHGFDTIEFVAGVRDRDRQRMAEARQRLSVGRRR